MSTGVAPTYGAFMGRMSRLIVPCAVAVALPVLAAPSAVQAGAGGYTTYVACSNKASGRPSHQCTLSEPKAAYFISTKHDATYKVCVKFPGRKKRLCASAQPADKGEKRIVTIATANTGTHEVRWYVDGKKVGSWNFQVTQG
jgi:hypothetical protein